ncbi:helix-turn-helix domain-containing protein [Paenibacillus psychroresistens]|uniref:Helix-turn-helix domain-containing protein n=1 Tax=Paenibacillus psychroresistens TaxID=1778678 RepID=A0A6B8RF91_9BACL|nr:helix-turn-helix domain-containing protein [Paenibacillus psychroresistens]QGQ94597.1 helix-turn-helix domain-containing protein [Paenibacillus psychroresistens]
MIMDPVRLTNSDYMGGNSAIRIFRHYLQDKIELHWHEFYEIALILKGEGNHSLNGSLYRLEPGSLLFLTPADFHLLEPDPKQTLVLLNMIFNNEVLSEPLQRLMVNSSEAFQTIFKQEEYQSLLAEFEFIWCEQQQELKVGSDLLRKGALERIMLLAERNLQLTGVLKAKTDYLKPAIRNAITYMQYHFREPLSLAKVAAHSNTSTNYFSELFHKETGSSFQIYLQELRLRFASSLLQASELSVIDICLASGFNSISHFDRTFKLKFGSTPSTYRRQQRN